MVWSSTKNNPPNVCPSWPMLSWKGNYFYLRWINTKRGTLCAWDLTNIYIIFEISEEEHSSGSKPNAKGVSGLTQAPNDSCYCNAFYLFIHSFISHTGLSLFLLLSPTAGSAWMPRNWKWQRWGGRHEPQFSTFQNPITRLLTSRVAPRPPSAWRQ